MWVAYSPRPKVVRDGAEDTARKYFDEVGVHLMKKFCLCLVVIIKLWGPGGQNGYGISQRKSEFKGNRTYLQDANPASRLKTGRELSSERTASLGGSLWRFPGTRWPPPYDTPQLRATNWPRRWRGIDLGPTHRILWLSRASAA